MKPRALSPRIPRNHQPRGLPPMSTPVAETAHPAHPTAPSSPLPSAHHHAHSIPPSISALQLHVLPIKPPPSSPAPGLAPGSASLLPGGGLPSPPGLTAQAPSWGRECSPSTSRTEDKQEPRTRVSHGPGGQGQAHGCPASVGNARVTGTLVPGVLASSRGGSSQAPSRRRIQENPTRCPRVLPQQLMPLPKRNHSRPRKMQLQLRKFGKRYSRNVVNLLKIRHSSKYRQTTE